MATDTRTGKGKAMRDAEAAAAAAAPPPPAQLSLLGGPEAVDVAAATEAAGGKRGPGRPSGAENRATRDMRAFLEANFRHPAITLARLQAQDPAVLARALGCKPVEALAQIRGAAVDLLPYLMGKMPVEDKDGVAVLPVLNLVDPRAVDPAFGAAETAVRVLDLASLEIVENQALDVQRSGAVGQPESDSGEESEAGGGLGGGRPVIWDHDDE